MNIIYIYRIINPIELKYDKGTIVIDGNFKFPFSVYDPRVGQKQGSWYILSRNYSIF